jgi:hypothetical protein
MKDEISRIFGFLENLLESCADHDITTDIFISPANPESYQSALDGIRDCYERIAASGTTREELAKLLTEDIGCNSPLLEGIVEPRDLLPLIGAVFTTGQEELIVTVCEEWGMAILPADPDGMAEMIRSAVHPLSLSDILTPEVTGMLRFPTIVQLQAAGRVRDELVRPAWDTVTRILIPAVDDPAVFHGKLNAAIFWYISGKGIIPDPLIPGPIIQALYDTGLFREGGIEALACCSGDGGKMVVRLFEAGGVLSMESEGITDIRSIFRIAFDKTTAVSVPAGSQLPGKDILMNYSRIVELSGHVLAGFVENDAGACCGTSIGRILEFVRSVADRPSCREVPGPGLIRELEKKVLEFEHLVRAVTRDYHWRALPMPDATIGYRPLVDLWPEKHLVLYNREEIAYRSVDSSKALVMEALYRHRYGIRPPDISTPLENGDWYIRLTSVIGIPRAVRTGSGVHPGVIRWMEKLRQEEYAPIEQMVNIYRNANLSLPDQFLEAAVFEGRTGEPASGFSDGMVKQAIEMTFAARQDIGSLGPTDETCLTIIQERIWPVFRQLCNISPGSALPGNLSNARSSPESHRNRITPRGTAPRVDTSVPSAHHPVNDIRGKSIEGKGTSLLDDDGLLVPGGNPGGEAKPGENHATRNLKGMQQNVPGGGSGSFPSPGDTNGDTGTGGRLQGITDTAGRMMDAVMKSRELLDEISSQDPHQVSGDGKGGDLRETVSTLRDLAGKIDEFARTLADQVRSRQVTSVPPLHGRTHPPGIPDGGSEDREVSETLVKTADTIKKAAREYREALGNVERQLESPGSDQGGIQHLTGMTKKAFMDLQQSGAEFQRISGGPSRGMHGGETPLVRLPEADDDPDSDGQVNATRRGRLEPSFVADKGYTPEVWESLSYFDASFDDGTPAGPEGPVTSRHSRDGADQRFEQNTQALTREAEIYLSSLRQRTRREWETIDEKAERVRKVALFESHTVGKDDYTTYQRFYQPVAGLIGVARKNIQQALQKTRATRDLTELTTGDDIDEENLAAVRTTMRIFRDRGREPDKTRWCISLLIDASSSMHDETVARKLQATIQTAILFGEAVNRVPGIRFEIAAFSDTEYIPLKRYQDDWNMQQGCYLIRQVVQATGGTNDVGAVSSALDRMNRLRMAAGANRMIFVLSDGQSGVGGREQMRTILATNKETRVFGWGIGPDMEKIEETYRPYGTWVPDIADLPRSMGEVLRRELGRPAMAGWKDDRAGHNSKKETEAGEALCMD